MLSRERSKLMYEWIKTLVIYLIISKLIIQIIPGASYKKYIHFLTGLMIILIIVEPVSKLLKFDLCDIEASINYINECINDEDSGQLSGDNLYDYYELSLATVIKNDINKMLSDNCQCEIINDKDNNISICRIYLSKKTDEETIAKIKKHIEDVYNIDVKSIYIISR